MGLTVACPGIAGKDAHDPIIRNVFHSKCSDSCFNLALSLRAKINLVGSTDHPPSAISMTSLALYFASLICWRRSRSIAINANNVQCTNYHLGRSSRTGRSRSERQFRHSLYSSVWFIGATQTNGDNVHSSSHLA